MNNSLTEDEEEDFFIVTTIEAYPMNNNISIESLLGKSIYRLKIDEIVNITSQKVNIE